MVGTLQTKSTINCIIISEEDGKIPRVFKIKVNWTNLVQTKYHKFTFWLPNDIHMSKPDMTQRNKHKHNFNNSNGQIHPISQSFIDSIYGHGGDEKNANFGIEGWQLIPLPFFSLNVV